MKLTCMRSVVLSLVFGGLLSSFSTANTFINARGGSNYQQFRLEPCTVGDPCGAIAGYANGSSQIYNQLLDMKNNGQVRLRLPIFHSHDAAKINGVVMSSVGANLSQTHLNNLKSLLQTIKSLGFQEVILGFFPDGNNSPAPGCCGQTLNWAGPQSSWTYPGGNGTCSPWQITHECYYQENWNVIYNVHNFLNNNGLLGPSYLNIKFDLMNEGAPPKADPNYNITQMLNDGFYGLWTNYARRLWIDYNVQFNSFHDSIGFSYPGGLTNPPVLGIGRKILGAVTVYKSAIYGVPGVFDLHVYHDGVHGSAYDQLAEADTALDNPSNPETANVGIVLGEAYYNDTNTRLSLLSGLSQSWWTRTIYYFLQWPKRSNGTWVYNPRCNQNYWPPNTANQSFFWGGTIPSGCVDQP